MVSINENVCANWQSSMHCKAVFLWRSLILSREKDPSMWLEDIIKCMENILYSTWKYKFSQTLSVCGFWWGYGVKTKKFTYGLILPLEPLPLWCLDHYTSLCLFLNNVRISIHVYPPTEMILLEHSWMPEP